jgi:hypothetical protein
LDVLVWIADIELSEDEINSIAKNVPIIAARRSSAELINISLLMALFFK